MRIGIINKIFDSSFVDGPGNRMSIFFQGCNMNCWYCHNPETIKLCLNCGDCVSVCPSKALAMNQGIVVWNEERCDQCDRCIKQCTHQSTPRVKMWSVEQLVQRVRANAPYIRGITCSGGECTLNKEFLTELFTKVKDQIGTKYSCLLDSNGSVIDFEEEQELMAVTDGVMLDIKCIDSIDHKELTGKNNQLVIKNARFLAKIGKLTEIRTVVVANGLNAKETIDGIAKQLEPYLDNQKMTYRLIRFRKQGVRSEYEYLDSPSRTDMEELATYAKGRGFRKVIIT